MKREILSLTDTANAEICFMSYTFCFSYRIFVGYEIKYCSSGDIPLQEKYPSVFRCGKKLKYLHFGKICWIRGSHFSREKEEQHQKF